jgi:hypothetical protein
MSIKIPDADGLPITSRRRKRRHRSMTQTERDALQFEAIKAEFGWSNDEWAATWLPWVRVAAVHVTGDHDKLKELMADFVKDGEASNVLEGLSRTKELGGAGRTNRHSAFPIFPRAGAAWLFARQPAS